MPYSKFDSNLEFNENEWVVSLINTKSGLSGMFGGHAKIVVEGVKKNSPTQFSSELFVAEYHIMEADRMIEETWIPQALRNTKCKYAVLFTERSNYEARKEQQYKEVQARSNGGLKPEEVMKMIQNIKQEQQNIHIGNDADFQYAGQWCLYSYKGGHNCTTWAEEKFDIIGIGKHLITDSSKASPFLHVNSANICSLL